MPIELPRVDVKLRVTSKFDYELHLTEAQLYDILNYAGYTVTADANTTFDEGRNTLTIRWSKSTTTSTTPPSEVT